MFLTNNVTFIGSVSYRRKSADEKYLFAYEHRSREALTTIEIFIQNHFSNFIFVLLEEKRLNPIPMKALCILFLLLIFNQSFAQDIPEKVVTSKVVEATVFLKGAQVLRSEKVTLTKGESIVKFTNLSPFIAPKSIQLKAGDELTVLGINHQQNFLDKSVKSEELLVLDKKLDDVDKKIELENTYLSILQEEIAFLQTNRLIGGKNETLNVATLKQAAEYYGSQLTALKLQTIERTGSVTGKVMDSEGQGLPGVTIIVSGSTIGTVSNFGGNYSLTLPNRASQLAYSSVGYISQTLSITADVMNVLMREDQVALNELVVTASGISNNRLKRMKGNEEVNFDVAIGQSPPMESIPLPIAQVENQTAINFEINTPYSIKSDSKNYTVDMVTYELPAFYQYFAVPKANNSAYLIAGVTDWEQYQLLEGEANVFFEQTFVGKSLLDVRYASDTLEISLGRDKMVTIEREKEKDFTEKSFLGGKKSATRLWKTTIKNNKSQPISMVVLDQVPVSTLEEIEVFLLLTVNTG